MPTEFKLPELGENIDSGDLIKVLVSVGDTIAEDQPLLELETDKATIEVPSPVSGKVKEIHVKDGETIKVGQLILTVEDGAAGRTEQKEEAKAELERRDQKAQRAGRKEPQAGQVPKERAAPSDVGAQGSRRRPSGQAEAEFEEEEAQEEEKQLSGREDRAPMAPGGEVVEFWEGTRPAAEPEIPREVVPAAPSVRRLARALGIDIHQVPGSGPGGRINLEDVKEHARRIVTGPDSRLGTQPAAVALPDFTKWGEIERKAMSHVRRKTAEHLSYAWTTVPHVTQFDKADITNLEELRKQFGKKAEAAGGKLTVTSIALKVAASALRAFPRFGASLDVAKEEVIYKKYCHIGVAADTDRGLLVPVIRNVDKKNILELSVELTALAEKARNRKITPEEMEGGIFTITNLGGIGGTHFSPIVNSPEVAILGIAHASLEAFFVNGQFEPRLMLPLSLSYDHRLIDGADAARFLRWVAEALEQPFLLALQG